MTDYYGKYDKKQTVQIFVDNMIWGNISINSFAFQMDGGGDLRRSLEQNMIDFRKNPTEETVDWIYETIIRLRVNGALSYELRDVSTEEMINGLRETIRQKDSEIETLHSENVRLVIELQKIEPTRRPVSKDFSALS
jgi:hypothetical protein